MTVSPTIADAGMTASRTDARLLPRVLICCVLINVVDGIDSQSIGIAAPLMAQSMAIPLVGFGPVFSAALLGGAVGAAGFGLLGDRFGRKWPLIAASLLIGVFTLLTAYAKDLPTLLAMRFACGLGLGGVAPGLIALTSQYAPPERRASIVTLMWASFPLGGLIGGVMNSYVVTRFGWPAMFVIGGVLAVCAAAVAAVVLPKSPSRLNPHHAATPSSRSQPTARGHGTLHGLFGGGRAAVTLCLWTIFFVAFGLLIVVVLWTPALLTMNGVSVGSSALVVACNGIGAMAGFASAGWLIDRFGARTVLTPAFLVGGVAVGALGFGAHSAILAAIAIGVTGYAVGIAAAGAVALAASVYPAEASATGAGAGMAFGRIGQMAAPPLVGALLAAGWASGPAMAAVGGTALIGIIALQLMPFPAAPSTGRVQV